MSNSSHNGGLVNVKRELQISIPSPESERVMAVRCADWKRLERGLNCVLDIPTNFSTLYGVLFGFGGSATLAIISLTYIKDLPAWVMPTFIALSVAFLFAGGFVVFFSRIQRKTRKTIMTNLLDDVRDIGSRYALEPTKGGEIIDATADKSATPH
jgi:hypothetical protein